MLSCILDQLDREFRTQGLCTEVINDFASQFKTIKIHKTIAREREHFLKFLPEIFVTITVCDDKFVIKTYSYNENVISTR